MDKPLLIGNAQAFWGDDPSAAARLVRNVPDLDYLTLDYLAEVSMSILAKQHERDPSVGYARDVVEVIESLTPYWREGRALKLVTNAGGLNPSGCAQACADTLRQAGCHSMKIGVVSGDDVLPILQNHGGDFRHLETGQLLRDIENTLVTANAYLGAAPIVEALSHGAQIVITGRVADPSLTVAPCAAHFGWSMNDFSQLAGATVAGHLIECGTQVTGGISTDWLTLPDPSNIGFPIAEVSVDGSCVITKPPDTGGLVNERTVKEQLLYELGDPGHYLSPDVTVSFLSLQLRADGINRMRVSNATGMAPPSTYKVSATYRAGYRASGTLVVFGRDSVEKATRCGEVVRERLRRTGIEPQAYHVELLGRGAVAPGVIRSSYEALELVLRISVADPRREVVDRFTRELMPLISAGPQGITGYSEGRPVVREVFGYWPTLIKRSHVRSTVEILEV